VVGDQAAKHLVGALDVAEVAGAVEGVEASVDEFG